MAYSANDLRPGHVIEYQDQLWHCLEAVHKTPGNKRAFVQAKLRSVKSGNQKDFKMASTEILERVSLVAKEGQFLYEDEAGYHFMDTESYEQYALTPAMVGEAKNYLLAEGKVSVTFYEGDPIGIELPQTLVFKVIEAEPNLRNATATAAYKNAVIETGLQVKVPPFIEVEESIIINTQTGEYVTRAK